MRTYQLILLDQPNQVIADKLEIATNFWGRLIGLLGRAELKTGQGLKIPSCRTVHMFFMRFPIDLVFCDANDKILVLQKNLKPWRISRYVAKADYVVELPEGEIERSKLEVGATLALRPGA